jgi:hypothetical protein
MDNNTSHLKPAALSVAELKDLLLVLETAVSHLVLPEEADAALERLRRSIERR